MNKQKTFDYCYQAIAFLENLNECFDIKKATLQEVKAKTHRGIETRYRITVRYE